MSARTNGERGSDLATQLRSLVRDAVKDEVESIVRVEWIDQDSAPIPRRAFMHACRSGAIPARKVGRRWLARPADVDRYIEARGASAPPQQDAIERDLTALGFLSGNGGAT